MTAITAPVPGQAVQGIPVPRESGHDPEVGPIAHLALRHRRAIVFCIQMVLAPLVYFTAFGLRFGFSIPDRYLDGLLFTLPLLLVLRLAALHVFGVYNGWWRHVGMFDLVALVKAITISSVVFGAVLFVGGFGAVVPRSILALEWGTAILAFGGVRFAVRLLREGGRPDAWSRGGRRTIIIGAGCAGARLLREVHLEPESGLHPVGFVDDNSEKLGWRIHGVSILGNLADLERLVAKHHVELLVIAVPSATREQMRRIVDRCSGLGIDFKIVPPLSELLDGRARMSQIRSVRVEDLLGREPVRLDLQLVRSDLRGKTVLITGGAGSIGSELARQVVSYQPARLVLVEQAESALYFIHHELVRNHPDAEIVPIIADVANEERVNSVFSEYRPDYVLHAAAYKHVPMMEHNVPEAVRNNVLGTLNVARCSARHRVRKFVLISTDKAVNPSSVMGATKRIAERIVLGLPELRDSATDFRAVRFGNVLGSDGSVVPLFKRQIEAGGPVTVTDPEVTRFFMTIPEAVQLVLQAAALPEAAGRISMLEMGEPVRIVTLAENLIRLSGLEPYTEMPIVFTGLRPGEKLYEELMSEVEETVPTAVDKIRVVRSDEDDAGALLQGLSELFDGAGRENVDAMLGAFGLMIPESVSPLRERCLGAPGRKPERVQQVAGLAISLVR